MALDLAHVIWGYGGAAADYGNFAPTLALFGIGLVLFTAHYLMLRGFYALEQTRRVFFIQCGIAATNIVAALVLTHGATPAETAPRLVVAYACSYAVGAATSYMLLSRTVGGLDGRRLLRFPVRLVIVVGLGAGIAWPARGGSPAGSPAPAPARRAGPRRRRSGLPRHLRGLARLLRLTEVTEVTRWSPAVSRGREPARSAEVTRAGPYDGHEPAAAADRRERTATDAVRGVT